MNYTQLLRNPGAYMLTVGLLVLITLLATSRSATAISIFSIANCTDLVAIDDDHGTYQGFYTLTADIDCEGIDFEPLMWGATPFSGTFDGAGYEIQNITINKPLDNEIGLFSKASNATIKNLTIKNGSVIGSDTVGSLVGNMEQSTVSNVHTNVDVSGDSYVGGLLGEMDYISSSISDSSSSGDISGSSGVGGLVGYLDNDGTIDRSFVVGGVTAAGSEVGGIVGSVDDNPIFSDTYVLGDVHGNRYCGGISGWSYGIESYRAYFAGIVTCNNGIADPLSGDADTFDYYDSFWDLRDGANPTITNDDLNGASAGKTTEEMKNIVTYTTDIDLLTPWDFEAVWDIDPKLNSGYPYLRWQTFPIPEDADGVDKTVEDAAPNSGDANNDGFADSEQSNVTSLVNVATDAYTVLEASSCSANNTVSTDFESEDTAKNDDDFDYPAGLLDFTLTGCVVGGVETITQYHYGVEYSSLSDLVLRKYNPNDDSYVTVDGAVMTEETIGGKVALKVVYQVIDGGPLDLDGTIDGTIVDPAGVALGVEILVEAGTENYYLPIMGIVLISSVLRLAYANSTKYVAF